MNLLVLAEVRSLSLVDSSTLVLDNKLYKILKSEKYFCFVFKIPHDKLLKRNKMNSFRKEEK
jgi:hypothetical protein